MRSTSLSLLKMFPRCAGLLLVSYMLPVFAHAGVISSTHPDQEAWYPSRNISVSWDVSGDALAVSTLYDDNAKSIPSKVYSPPIKEKTFIADEDGIHYFHVQRKNEKGWGEVEHYTFQIDTKAPTGLSVSFPEGSVTASPQPAIKLTAMDEMSGVKDVLISIDDQATTTYAAVSVQLYKLPKALPGKHTASITVRDRAGNASHTTIGYSILPIDPPYVADYTRFAGKGDVIKVQGTTYPSSTVQLIFLNVKTGESIIATTRSDGSGTFIHTHREELPPGVYEMRARTTDKLGAESEYTGPHVMSIERTTLIRIGMFIMNWLSLVLVIILAGTLAAATLWYSLLQFSRFRRKIRRTMEEAEYALKMNVLALRRDTEEFHTILKKAEKKRELTKEEQSILRKFKKRLDAMEKDIEKKLEQIG